MTLFLLIFLIFLFLYALIIDFYRRSWNSIPVFEPTGTPGIKVSVVIAVRNEADNIPALLSFLSFQDYPRHLFEVIIINDHSTDATWKLLEQYNDLSFRLVAVQMPEGIFSKKKAIEKGIGIATGTLIITTDADCQLPSKWISAITSYYQATGARFIAAPVLMEGRRSLRDVFQSLDFLTLQGITGAAVNKHFHSMCNGANLAYERQCFIDVNGFEGIDQIPSGDDMLLMHKIFTRYPDKVLYLKSREATVSIKPENSWKDFLNQRIRWASKAVHYKDKKIFYVLLLTYLINIGFAVMAAASIVNIRWLSFFVLLLVAKILIEYPFVNSVALFFGRQKLMKYFPLLQPVHILYTIVAGWLGRFGSYEWKSRTVKNKAAESL